MEPTLAELSVSKSVDTERIRTELTSEPISTEETSKNSEGTNKSILMRIEDMKDC